MFQLPKHVELFLAQLPTDVDSCLQDIRTYASHLRYAENSQRFDLLYDIENILSHLRYRYIILTNAQDEESQAYKLLYECELPEMIYRGHVASVTFGDFSLPICEASIEILDEGIMLDESEDDCIIQSPECSIEAYVHEHGLSADYLDPTSTIEIVEKNIRCDSHLVAQIATHIVEPLRRATVNKACISCHRSDHKDPVIFGSEFKPTICSDVLQNDQLRAEWSESFVENLGFRNMRENLRIGKPITCDVDYRVALGIYLQSGDSIYCGKDYILKSEKEVPPNNLQRLAMKTDLRSFVSRVIG